MSIRRIGLVLVLVVGVAMVACSNGAGSASYVIQSGVACPAVDALAGERSADPLPAEFRPVLAVRCTFQPALAGPGASPSYGFAWVAAQRSTGPFDDLVRSLRLPPQGSDRDTVCPAVMVAPGLLALTDASGHTILPALPGTECRVPLPEVSSAIDALSWVEADRQP